MTYFRTRPRPRSDAPRVPSHATATTTMTLTTTTTTTRRGYADPLGTDDARHHIARRIRDVTVRALESYILLHIISYHVIFYYVMYYVDDVIISENYIIRWEIKVNTMHENT